MAKEGIRWDEGNLAANDDERDAAHARGERQQILEPKTPFHNLEDDGETPESWPPKAAAATQAKPTCTPQNSVATVASRQGSMEDVSSPDQNKALNLGSHDLSALTASALERREAPQEDDEVEKRIKFEENRKKHYKTGKSLAELRAEAAKAMEEEDDEDED
eukprot:42945-Prymnesium_polylepis.1